MANAEKNPNGRVVVLDTGYFSYAEEQEILNAAGYRLEAFEGEHDDRQGRFDFAKDAVGLLIRWTRFDEEAFDALPALRCVVRYGVGYDNIDLDAATAHGVRVANVQGYANHSVSDHALALILGSVRAFSLAPKQVWEGFLKPPRTHLPELREMTLGIVGLGRIGGTLCEKARPLFRRVIASDPYIAKARFKNLGAEEVAFPALLAESDVVSIHCNLTEETRRLFGSEALARMKPGAVLVNTSRGPVVEESALLDALNANRLFAAGLDVFDEEPPGDDQRALIEHPHVIATGHYAWFSTAAHAELQRRAAENLVAMLQGRLREDCLNPGA